MSIDQSRERWRLIRAAGRIKRSCETLPLGSRSISGLAHGGLSVLSAFLAYLPTHAIGLQDSFWSAITAITVAQTEYRAMTSTARDQFTGAAVGGIVALACYFGIGQSL